MPFFSKLFIKLRINRRIINFLAEKSYYANNHYDFSKKISQLIQEEKLTALDIGAQGGFNSDNFFPKKYNIFFENVLIEPIDSEAKKLKNEKNVINKGLWSSKTSKKLYILKNRLGSSSMFEPDLANFEIHNIKEEDYEKYKVTQTIEVECDTIQNLLSQLKIDSLDYLKIDTQGSELEIIKGIGIYRPLLIKLEAHIFSMYKGVAGWHKILNYLYDLNYIAIDWKPIGSHNTRAPAEIDMIFIPNFNSIEGGKIINNSKEKFISLMLIFGQLNLLKIIIRKLNLKYEKLEKFEDLYFN